MFKKLKDKLAEEVKSSPQRIQQFAQAAQAAVTSASSSISDITNNDLFSIGDIDHSQSRSLRTPTSLPKSTEQNTFQDVSLMQSSPLQASTEEIDYPPRLDQNEGRQRRLSNSSFSSDVSFRLPSYESPSLYHLQSDIEVSASEAEERGFSSGPATLDRVTKEQLYTAYKRTQQRYEKYRTQYADLARHYKFLERDNAKARSVLVETQDKALRRISELREQCTLEQSAKAHLEKALRLEIDERNMKIDALNTKIKCIQNSTEMNNTSQNSQKDEEVPNEMVPELQLIDFSGSNDKKPSGDDNTDTVSTNKTEKLEQLINKYKESFKAMKEKNAQLTAELHILSQEIENKNKESEQLKSSNSQLLELERKVSELHETNEQLQNELNTYEFNKTKEKSTLELDLQKASEEIVELQGKIGIFNKREEEYAISLAENKLSIHKELESKETEIKSLKDNITICKNEVQSLNIVISDYKKSLAAMEEENSKIKVELNELNNIKIKITEKESLIKDLMQKCKSFQQSKTKFDEEYKCLQLQNKQETAEKLAMIDRNVYLEAKNTQLTEEILKKGSQVNKLENQLLLLRKESEECNENVMKESFDRDKTLEELESWRNKYYTMESEIQDEREELVKLQSEIEKLLQNHEVLQTRNTQLLLSVSELTDENTKIKQSSDQIKKAGLELVNFVKIIKNMICVTSEEARLLKKNNDEMIYNLRDKVLELISIPKDDQVDTLKAELDKMKLDFSDSQKALMNVKQMLESTSSELIEYQEYNKQLIAKVDSAASENVILKEESKNREKEYEITLNESSGEKTAFLAKLKELESVNESLQSTLSREREEFSSLNAKMPLLEQKQQKLLQKLKDVEAERVQYQTTLAELEIVKSKHETLLTKNKDFEEKEVYIKKLEENLDGLSQENTSLKNQSQTIATSLKTMETEINDVRKSHAEIEREKDNLNSIIKKLEENENAKKDTCAVHAQTDEKNYDFELIVEENKILKDKCEQFKQEKEILHEKCISVENEKETLLSEVASLNTEYGEENKFLKLSNSELLTRLSEFEKICDESELKTKNDLDLADKFVLMKTDYDNLKDENKRLTSDIEGLQSYLAKISKENSSLNDKLRELIASSEHENTSRDFADLQNGESCSDKLNDLLRENTLLAEENLELKDQLRLQNFDGQPNNNSKQGLKNESELEMLKEKYNNLLATKSKYEKQMADLEYINRSVNVNMQSTQENNEKLRLSNEKLERRLDEALVSLRHLHSLQENTELEYLRNILYEYLTGSGTHSITLAKVLAAVVKFDEMQTNTILQKEKERQGLLRQLGLL